MDYYAIILDWDMSHANPLLRLIATDKSIANLRGTTGWDPGANFPRIGRSSFSVSQVEVHNLTNNYDQSVTPAHICSVKHI